MYRKTIFIALLLAAVFSQVRAERWQHLIILHTNDIHGHLAGDKVLAVLAGDIMARLRPYDKLFRYGGEEFLISMPHTDSKSGLNVVERLREGIAASSIHYEGKEIRITASFGLTLLDLDVSVEQTVERADRALYAAKSSGRNCTRIWDSSLDT